MTQGGTLSCLRVGGQGRLYRSGDFELSLEGHMDIFWMKEGKGRGEHSKQRKKDGQRQRKDQARREILRSTERLEHRILRRNRRETKLER